ncbi:MAG: cation:proton antiporter [Candidatus Caenarcaniphilales bacterium]|nr:cation:proton antiporter [Candidatus Caenarcaniphilales bacterium]
MAAVEHTSIPTLLMGIVLIWSVSKFLNIFLDRFKLPGVLGELFTGLIFGVLLFLPFENVWGWTWLADKLTFIKNSDILFALGELGILLLLFEVGLETELDKITSVGKEALFVALGGVVAPFLFSWLFSILFPALHWTVNLVLFIGLVLAATSIGVTARVFKDLKVLNTLNAQVVLGAAVIDDIVGLILLSVISALVTTGAGGVSALMVFITILKAAVFLGLSAFVGKKVSINVMPWLNKMGKFEPLSLMLWVLCFGFFLAYLADLGGLAPIVGAFAAGVALDGVRISGLFGETKSIEDFIAPIRAILAPIFFVKVGLAIDPSTIFGALPLILTLIACVSKLISGWVFLPFKTSLNRLVVGVGMMPRGEVGLVVAAIGNQIGLLTGELYSGVLVAVILTTFIAPLWLQILLKPRNVKEPKAII